MNRMSWAVFVLLIISLSGCSGLKTYPNTGEKNLVIRTNTSGSLFMSVNVFLHLYHLKDECKSDYLGTVKLKNGNTDIAIPTGSLTYLAFVFHTDGITPHTSIVTPKPGMRYIADVRYADRIYGVSLHESGAGGRLGREIERQSRNCPDTRALPEYR